MATHLVIPDTQIKPDLSDFSHIEACGNLIHDRQPDVVVNLMDWWDMPSLSSYDEGKITSEGRRYQDDVWAGNDAMELLRKRAFRRKTYDPRLVATIGNHEHRIMKHVAANPRLAGSIGISDLDLDGWEVHPFLKPVRIDGIAYAHYFYNQMSGRAYTGAVETMLKNIKESFVMGHQQRLAWARADLAGGGSVQGLVAGAFYQHDEDYKGPQGNNHWRGVCLLHNVKDGVYDLETISLDTLMEEYGP